MSLGIYEFQAGLRGLGLLCAASKSVNRYLHSEVPRHVCDSTCFMKVVTGPCGLRLHVYRAACEKVRAGRFRSKNAKSSSQLLKFLDSKQGALVVG